MGVDRWWNGRSWDESWQGLQGDKLPDIGDWLNGTFSDALVRWRAVATISIITTAPASVMLWLGLRRLTDGVVITDDEITGWSNGRLPFSITVLCVAAVLWYVASLAIPVLMLRTVDGERAAADTAGEIRSGLAAIGRAIRLIPRIIGWTMVLLVIMLAPVALVVVLLVVSLPLGLIACLALFVLFVFYVIRLAFFTQSLIDQPGQPFTRSIDVSRGRWWPVVGRLLLIGVFTWLISAAVQAFGGLAQGTGAGTAFRQNQVIIDDDGTFVSFELTSLFPNSGTAMVVGVITSVLISVLASSVAAAGLARLYRTRNLPPSTTV